MRGRILFVVVLLAGLVVGASMWFKTVPAPEPTFHTVVRGDTLSKLARAHGCTVDELQAWNGLSSDRIDIGQQLVVGYTGGPAPTVSPPASPARPKTPRSRTSRPTPSATPPTAPAGSLSLPAAQPCLAGPELQNTDDEAAFAASAGLDRSQIKSAMDGFLPTLQRCISGDWPVGTIDLSITVACSGRVDRVHVRDDGGLDATLVACVQDTLRYAPFPAHDLPDGETFGYPLRFSQ